MIGRTTFWRTWLVLGILALFLSSCKSKSALTGATVDDKLTAKTIIRTHNKNQAEFKTLSGRMHIEYTDGETTQSFNVSLRMEKDKAIWMSAPLGVVKAYITPERVSFYNKLQNEYFDGDFTYLSNLLGTELDFDKVQNLLLGRALFDLRDGRYMASVSGNTYELKPRENSLLFKIFYLIEPANFMVTTQQLSQPLEKRLLEIRYKDYQVKGNQVLPGEIGITAIDTDQRNVIALAYRNVELNRPLNFPYQIPNGYEEIQLK
jgi:outer membrane lipoprotein-sorting protein